MNTHAVSSLLLASIAMSGCSTQETNYSFLGDSQEYSQTTIQQLYASKVVNLRDPASGLPIRVLEAPMPEYSVDLRRAGIEGRVIVGYYIEMDGRVSDAWVIGSAPPELAELALAAIRRWRFEPVGKPISVGFQQGFIFKLKP